MSAPASPDTPDSGGLPRPYGSYVLVRRLAEGGMAEIFLAKRQAGEGASSDVVIKRMLGHLAGVPECVEMFRDEARLAALLVHPNLVRVYELGFVEERYFLCMEYLAGEDFSAMVRTASLRGEWVPVPLVMRVLADSARGLHHAHECRDATGQPLHIVHRDVSPSNLYATYGGQVKVLDFGVAKAESRRTRTRPGMVKGKYLYMAPEQARGDEVDRRADVFSLGVSLYEALTHVRPFAREDELAGLHALLKGEFQPPRALRPELSPELEAVVLKAMALEPARRFATAAEFAEALEQLLARESTGAGPGALARYLRASFGEARFLERTRTPTLASLGLKAFPTSAPRASVIHAPSQRLPTVRPRWQRRGRWVGLGAGAALVLAAAVYLGTRERAPEVPVAEPSEAKAPPVAASAAVPEAPPAATPPVPDEAPAGETSAQGERSQASLEVADVLRVVSGQRARITACFERYKRELPAYEGDVQVLFTIVASGKAQVAVQGALADTRVGQCLEKQLKRLRFPAHREDAVVLRVPLGYSVMP